MKSNALCPISNKTIDEHSARITALLTVLTIATYLGTGIVWIMLFLAFDFLLRAIPLPGYSPLAILTKGIAGVIALGKKPINAGPKIFAARIGFMFSTLVVLTHAASWGNTPIVIASILGVFAFLEGAFGICVACKMYPPLYKIFYNKSFNA